jgi:hypothetical protein
MKPTILSLLLFLLTTAFACGPNAAPAAEAEPPTNPEPATSTTIEGRRGLQTSELSAGLQERLGQGRKRLRDLRVRPGPRGGDMHAG